MGRTYPKLKRQSVQRKAARKRNRERAVPRSRNSADRRYMPDATLFER
jgi:hypothetical protein